MTSYNKYLLWIFYSTAASTTEWQNTAERAIKNINKQQ